jgi:hypothetical protein
MKSKYDWINVPNWVNWIATDSDGEVCGFEEMPISYDDYMWYGRKHIYLSFVRPVDNWKESLEKRPSYI